LLDEKQLPCFTVKRHTLVKEEEKDRVMKRTVNLFLVVWCLLAENESDCRPSCVLTTVKHRARQGDGREGSVYKERGGKEEGRGREEMGASMQSEKKH
jgi:hypothetical protein